MMLNFNLERIFILQEKGKFPKRSVWINFDDMDETIYENAYPILKNIKYRQLGLLSQVMLGKKTFTTSI